MIKHINTILGLVCMWSSIYGLWIENYTMACAYALFFIAYQQTTE